MNNATANEDDASWSRPALDAPPFEPATIRRCCIIPARIQGRELAQEVILPTPIEVNLCIMILH